MHRRDSGQVVSASTSPVKRGLYVVEQRHPLCPPPPALCLHRTGTRWLSWMEHCTYERQEPNKSPGHFPFFGAVRRETESGVCFGEMLNKDNLENGLRHSAASVPLFSYTRTHTTPQGCFARVCFGFAPRLRVGVLRESWRGRLLRCMAIVETGPEKI